MVCGLPKQCTRDYGQLSVGLQMKGPNGGNYWFPDAAFAQDDLSAGGASGLPHPVL